MKTKVHPEQPSLLVHDPYTRADVPNPAVVTDAPAFVPDPAPDYDPRATDPIPGLSTPLVEGWGVMHRVIKDIARERSNRGFVGLPVDSRAVRKFAQNTEFTPHEVQPLVDQSSGKKYERAAGRLVTLREKQVKRARDYNALRKVVDDQVILDLLPMEVSGVEHRYFYANSPAEARTKKLKRDTIARFVKKHER